MSAALAVLIASAEDEPSAERDDYFRDHVEPLLKKRCYACHSHASELMEGGLSLDWRSGWEKGGGRGPAIVPGDPDASLLIRAVRYTDPELKMPDDPLSNEEVAILERWVKEGAYDPRAVLPSADAAQISTDWWSLRPLVRPAVPDTAATNPIDAFIRNRLELEGLQPSQRADRRTLIRRLTIDLHGLLPTPEETLSFVNDASPDAYGALVDRLLASPRYGERWARHWLDTIHFADSHGFEHDVFRPHAWRYRDYVIDSLNRDTPWDRFIREQLAVDVFYPQEFTLVPALGFLGAGTYDHSAAITAPMSFENLDRDDMVTQTIAAFVSTTANCARCHAHKFDPISQEDYYALQAVFAGIGKGDIPFDADPEVGAQRSRWNALKSAADSRQSEILSQPENQELVAQYERQRGEFAGWQPLTIETFVSTHGQTLQRQEDGSFLASGTAPEKDVTSVTASIDTHRITAIRLDVLSDDSLPMKGAGRANNGNLHLSEFEIRTFRADSQQGERIAIARATADFDQDGWTILHAIDGNDATAWGIHPQVGLSHFAVFELEKPLVQEPGVTLHLLMKQIHGGSHLIGRFRLSATDGPADLLFALPADADAILAKSREQRTEVEQITLSAAILKQKADIELRQLPEQQKVYAAGAVAQNERGVVRFDTPREIHMLTRGDIERPGVVIPPGTISAIDQLPSRFELPEPHAESARRAALAVWISDSTNPLTWRSIANRVWHYHFGRGLCDTPNDFGRMGGTPSHPELLDWLACEFREQGGSLKFLHRLICMSETYQQTSDCPAELWEADPENVLLARMSRRRMDAESFRDSVLLASGRIDFTMGGPGIANFSSRPGAQLTPYLNYDDFDWDGPGAGRRSIYRVVWRGIPDPLFDALDFPDLGLLAPKRGFSASPLQALTLLNNRFVLHQAEQMASRAQAAQPMLDDQVRVAVHWVWQRDPTDDEQTQLRELAGRQGLEAVCRLLLNSNEFLFVD
ncbi:MAG: PSD1 and planctomycete cytochrome C domain-containing protein [Planctomycetota bacterium]|nr:PSD1 and planctomycete cytochrome C domain-containing protein [Planctomycetota bacterium]MDA1214073.1 PSD1 and planctomycete cytochrome C domain-containing protein [Planctomycetota bacterium]